MATCTSVAICYCCAAAWRALARLQEQQDKHAFVAPVRAVRAQNLNGEQLAAVVATALPDLQVLPASTLSVLCALSLSVSELLFRRKSVSERSAMSTVSLP